MIKLQKNAGDSQIVDSVILEAVLTKRKLQLNPKELEDKAKWLKGWK